MEARGDSHRSRIKFVQTGSEMPMPKKSVTLPLDVFHHIFEFLAIPQYEEGSSPNMDAIYTTSITPMLSHQHFHTLLSLSLTCKSFREMVIPLLLRYLLITSSSEFDQLLSLMPPSRQNPVESLVIKAPEKDRSLRQITSRDFLHVVKACSQLRALRLVSPLSLYPRPSGALRSLARCGILANITNMELNLFDCHYQIGRWDSEGWYRPDDIEYFDPSSETLSQVLMLMPKLTVLHVLKQDLNRTSLIDLRPYVSPPTPPFRLESLMVDQDYWNLDLNWLTSTSHNSLKSVMFATTWGRFMLLNLDHPWTTLHHLHMLGRPREVMAETVRSCPNLDNLAMEIVAPYLVEEEECMIQCFDALHIPLHHFTLIWRPPIAGNDVSYRTDCGFLASAILNHPKLCELETITVEIPFPHHKSQSVYQDVMPGVRKACEAKAIHFTIIHGKEPKHKTTYYR